MLRLVGALLLGVLVSFAEGSIVDTCQVPFCTQCSGSACESCLDGYYLDSNECRSCPSIEFCTSLVITCTGPNDSNCTSCADGRFLQEGSPDACPECTPIAHCTHPDQITCTTADDSQCPGCDDGY